jgi:hypothetical protein
MDQQEMRDKLILRQHRPELRCELEDALQAGPIERNYRLERLYRRVARGLGKALEFAEARLRLDDLVDVHA